MSDIAEPDPGYIPIQPVPLDGGFRLRLIAVPPPPAPDRVQTLVSMGGVGRYGVEVRMLGTGISVGFREGGRTLSASVSQGLDRLYQDAATDLADPFVPGLALVFDVQMTDRDGWRFVDLFIQGERVSSINLPIHPPGETLQGAITLGRSSDGLFGVSRMLTHQILLSQTVLGDDEIRSAFEEELKKPIINPRRWV